MEKPKDEFKKGLIYILITFPLLFLAPVLITVGLKAIKHYNNYIFLIIGIIIGIAAVILGFKGIQLMLNGFFNKSDD